MTDQLPDNVVEWLCCYAAMIREHLKLTPTGEPMNSAWEAGADRLVEVEAFLKTLPTHSGGCSNQNVLNPYGKYLGVNACGCTESVYKVIY